MILYLDTSALVKLFVDEPAREVTVAAVAAAANGCTSAAAYVETRSAFARKLGEGSLDDADHRRLVRAFDLRWPALLRRELTLALAFQAGELAERFRLRGYDAVHLASALDFQRRFGEITFLGFDDRLNAAAEKAGLTLYGGDPHQ